MTIGLEHYLTAAAALFVIGIFGIFLNRKNIVVRTSPLLNDGKLGQGL